MPRYEPWIGAGGGDESGLPAAGQLLGLLTRPEVLQALMSMVLGRSGRPTTSVGNTLVPVSAVTNLIGALANQVSAEYLAAIPGHEAVAPRYLMNVAGEFVVALAVSRPARRPFPRRTDPDGATEHKPLAERSDT